MWSKVVGSGLQLDRSGCLGPARGSSGMIEKLPQLEPNEPELKQFLTAFTSLAAGYAVWKRNRNVSRQSPNPRGRKGTSQGPRGVQARDRREIQREILYHVPGWQGCPGISLRGVGADRAEPGEAL